jgi:hypothetical protein
MLDGECIFCLLGEFNKNLILNGWKGRNSARALLILLCCHENFPPLLKLFMNVTLIFTAFHTRRVVRIMPMPSIIKLCNIEHAAAEQF